MSLQGSLSIERMCQVVPVSRRSFYRSLKEQQPVEEEMEVRSAIQQIALEHRRRYGYRRITAELHRRGMPVNHKRVARIMREDNLLGMQPERFVVTTNSNHKLEVYLNLASRMKLTGINQLWVADITYIRLKAEFVYLAVILDGFSRKVVGWALDRTLAIRLTMRATGASHRDSTTRTWLGASLRSRIAIRFRRIRESPREQPRDSEHEPASKSV
jgi:putative transposase